MAEQQHRRAADVEIEVIKQQLQRMLDMLEGDGLPACRIEGLRIAQMQTDIQRINNEIFGNGKPGLKSSVERLDERLQSLRGSVVAVGLMILGAVITNIVMQWFS